MLLDKYFSTIFATLIIIKAIDTHVSHHAKFDSKILVGILYHGAPIAQKIRIVGSTLWVGNYAKASKQL